MSQRIESNETTKATAQPASRITVPFISNEPPLRKNLTTLSRLAPNITGMARKNVNLDATSRVQPKSKPPMMVEPEREVPGTSESTWKHPMPSAVFHERSSSEAILPKSVSSAASASAAELAKCAPAGRDPGSAPAAMSSTRLTARRRSITMNATPYTTSAAATTGAL